MSCPSVGTFLYESPLGRHVDLACRILSEATLQRFLVIQRASEHKTNQLQTRVPAAIAFSPAEPASYEAARFILVLVFIRQRERYDQLRVALDHPKLRLCCSTNQILSDLQTFSSSCAAGQLMQY